MNITDDEIRIAAQSWVGLTDAPNPNATSFAAGAKFVLQKLQQTPCSTLREVLVQMHTEEFNAFSHATEDDEMKKHTTNMKAIQSVMQFISERQPVA